MSKDLASDVIIPLELTGLLELKCINSVQDLIEKLPELLVGKAPRSITNVLVGPNPPASTATDTVWFQLNNAAEFVGIRLFSGGEFTQIYPPEFKDWVFNVTGNGDLVVTNTASKSGRVLKQGFKEDFVAEFEVTVTSTTGTILKLNFPDVIVNGNAFAASIDFGSGPQVAVGKRFDENTIGVAKSDFSAFTNGTLSVVVSGFVEIA